MVFSEQSGRGSQRQRAPPKMSANSMGWYSANDQGGIGEMRMGWYSANEIIPLIIIPLITLQVH